VEVSAILGRHGVDGFVGEVGVGVGGDHCGSEVVGVCVGVCVCCRMVLMVSLWGVLKACCCGGLC
jgi:hypothetical protein